MVWYLFTTSQYLWNFHITPLPYWVLYDKHYMSIRYVIEYWAIYNKHCIIGYDGYLLCFIVFERVYVNKKYQQIWEKFKAAYTSMMRFIRVTKSVIVAAMESILNLVSHEKSPSPTNLSSEYDDVFERWRLN